MTLHDIASMTACVRSANVQVMRISDEIERLTSLAEKTTSDFSSASGFNGNDRIGEVVGLLIYQKRMLERATVRLNEEKNKNKRTYGDAV